MLGTGIVGGSSWWVGDSVLTTFSIVDYLNFYGSGLHPGLLTKNTKQKRSGDDIFA